LVPNGEFVLMSLAVTSGQVPRMSMREQIVGQRGLLLMKSEVIENTKDKFRIRISLAVRNSS